MTTTLRIREPQELLALIPYQLGFRPQSSAVVVSLRGSRRRVGLVARVDLADLRDEDDGRQLARELVSHVAADGGRSAVLVLYTEAPSAEAGREDDDVWEAARTVQDAAAPFLDAVDVWVVTATGYFALECADRHCCPAGGRPLDDLAATVTSAHMVLAGALVVSSRDELARVPRAPEPDRRRANAAANRWRARRRAATTAARVHAWRRDGLATWRDALDGHARGLRPDAPALGRIEAALEDTVVRDAVLMTLVPGVGDLAEVLVDAMDLPGAAGDGPGAHGAVDTRVGAAIASIVEPDVGIRPDESVTTSATAVLEAVIGHGRRYRQAPALTLLALLTWWRGGGARAGALLDRALGCDPGYRLALLVARALAAGMPPGWVRTGDDGRGAI
ncbi:DUF4192 domain-containing protein [Sanguibacter sp. 25GB23B1]|uniref:DUF4192 domain-containing protein n=1 Tax=unclassified Sanguibacter TaxID=2645534 RepID=UPI0032AF1BDF